MMKQTTRSILVKAIILCLVAGGALVIGQIWFDLVKESTFIKILTTLGIIAIVSGILLAVGSDLSDEKALKDKGYLD